MKRLILKAEMKLGTSIEDVLKHVQGLESMIIKSISGELDFTGNEGGAIEIVVDGTTGSACLPEDLKNMSVKGLGLSVRSVNALDLANISTVGQLVSKTDAEIAAIPNWGKKGRCEVRDKLLDKGVSVPWKVS